MLKCAIVQEGWKLPEFKNGMQRLLYIKYDARCLGSPINV